jgi:hypothetical protein
MDGETQQKVVPTEISERGQPVMVPGIVVGSCTVIVTGKWLRVASVNEEDWTPRSSIPDLPSLVEAVRGSGVRADLLTYAQGFTDIKPHFSYAYEWDNVAAIPVATYTEWWEKHVSHDLRRDVKRAEKRGVTVRSVELDDELVRGIKEIYDELPMRQGRRFWHYGKDAERVRRENSSFLDRSEFIGAYLGEELIGFIKIVYVDDVARMMQILCKERHKDKRPANALIAKAVETCERRKCGYLTYGNYTYDNKRNSSVVQFKHRNGFEEILFPRYYVPLTARGRIVLALGLHRGLKRFIPEKLLYLLLDVRARAWKMAESSAGNGKPEDGELRSSRDQE